MSEFPLIYDPKPLADMTPAEALADYKTKYAESVSNPEKFWDSQAQKLLTWYTPYKKVCGGGFIDGDVHWFTEVCDSL
jgi:acetyl-CoA synthetase